MKEVKAIDSDYGYMADVQLLIASACAILIVSTLHYFKGPSKALFKYFLPPLARTETILL